jgi:hypothetical protein
MSDFTYNNIHRHPTFLKYKKVIAIILVPYFFIERIFGFIWGIFFKKKRRQYTGDKSAQAFEECRQNYAHTYDDATRTVTLYFRGKEIINEADYERVIATNDGTIIDPIFVSYDEKERALTIHIPPPHPFNHETMLIYAGNYEVIYFKPEPEVVIRETDISLPIFDSTAQKTMIH